MAARSKKPMALAACCTLAGAILNGWQPREPLGGPSCSVRMLKVLERLGSLELVQHFLRDIFPRDFDGLEGPALVRLAQRYGWDVLAPQFRAFFTQQKPTDPFVRLEAILALGEALCCLPPTLTAERRGVCATLIEPLIQVLERWDHERSPGWYGPREKRSGVVAGVVRIFATLGARDPLERYLSRVLTDPRRYDLHEVLLPDVKAIYSWLADLPAARPAAFQLVQHCLAALREATAQPIEPPCDWSREANLGCRCADCQALSRFLRDPEQHVGRFSVRKERRRHLHQQIEQHRCDVTHVTERVGSPQTLVCTKTQASYERRRNEYHRDKKELAILEKLAADRRRSQVRRASGRSP